MEVSRRVVAAVVVLVVGLVGAIGFLLGRESTRRDAPRAAAVEPAPTPHDAPRAAAVEPAPTSPPPTPVPPALPALPAPPALPAQPVPGADAAPVRDYFARVAAIQEGPAADPSTLAYELVASAIGGDSSGFDTLIQGAEDGLAQLRQLQPPAACADYHRKLDALLTDSLALLRSVRTAIARQDTDGLAGLAARANALQARTAELETEANAIKARYGLH